MSALVIASGSGAHGRERELPEELALASDKQHLGDVRSRENADVPASPVGNVGQHLEAEARQPHLDRAETEHVVGVSGGEAKNGRPTDVLACEVKGTKVERFDEKMQVFGGGLAVVGTCPMVGITEAAEIHREYPVAAGEQGDELAEGPPRFGETMHQQDRRPLASRRHVVQLVPLTLA